MTIHKICLENTGKHRIQTIEVDFINNTVNYVFKIPNSSDEQEKIALKKEIKRHVQDLFSNLQNKQILEEFLRSLDASNYHGEYKIKIKHTDKASLKYTSDKLRGWISYQNKIPSNFSDFIEVFLNREEKELFAVGNRSVLHEKKGKYKRGDMLNYDRQFYEVCNGKIDFTHQRTVASTGTNREVILLNFDDKLMQAHYLEFSNQLSAQAQQNSQSPTLEQLKALFKKAIDYTNTKIPNTPENDNFQATKKPEDYTIGKTQHKDPVYSLPEIIQGEIGVCRHRAFFTLFLLGEYFRNNKLNISIHQCRNDLTEGAHTWAVLKQGNELFLIDPTWASSNQNTSHSKWEGYFHLTDPEDYKKACKKYPTEVINHTIQRAVNCQEEFAKELDKTNKDNDPANSERLKFLIKASANADPKFAAHVNIIGPRSRWSAAHVAACTNDIELMNLVTEKNPNLLHTCSLNRHRSPLFYAKSINMVELLIKQGADLNQKDRNGVSAIDALLEDNKSNKEFINYLNAHKAWETDKLSYLTGSGTPNQYNLYRLHDIIQKRCESLKSQTNDKNYQHTLKEYAELNSQIKKAFLKNIGASGASILVFNAVNIELTSPTPSAEFVLALHTTNLTDKDTLLAIVLEKHPQPINTAAVQALIQAGAHVNYSHNNGLTAAHVAASQGKLDIIQCLALYKADLNLKVGYFQKSPLFYATNIDVVKRLIRYGADLNQTDGNGISAYQALLEANQNHPTFISELQTIKTALEINKSIIFDIESISTEAINNAKTPQDIKKAQKNSLNQLQQAITTYEEANKKIDNILLVNNDTSQKVSKAKQNKIDTIGNLAKKANSNLKNILKDEVNRELESLDITFTSLTIDEVKQKKHELLGKADILKSKVQTFVNPKIGAGLSDLKTQLNKIENKKQEISNAAQEQISNLTIFTIFTILTIIEKITESINMVIQKIKAIDITGYFSKQTTREQIKEEKTQLLQKIDGFHNELVSLNSQFSPLMNQLTIKENLSKPHENHEVPTTKTSYDVIIENIKDQIEQEAYNHIKNLGPNTKPNAKETLPPALPFIKDKIEQEAYNPIKNVEPDTKLNTKETLPPALPFFNVKNMKLKAQRIRQGEINDLASEEKPRQPKVRAS